MAQRLKETAFEQAASPRDSGLALTPELRHFIRTGLHILGDGAAVASSYYLAYLIRFQWPWWLERFPLRGELPEWALYQKILYTVVPLWLLIFAYSSKLYNSPWIGSADRFLRVLHGCVLGTGATMVATYIYERLQYSRMMLLCALPVALVLLSASQALVLWIDEWLSRIERARPVLLVGGGVLAAEIKSRISSRHPGAVIRQLDDLPGNNELEVLLKNFPAAELILLRSSLPHTRILQAAEICDARGISFKMLPDLLELRFGEVQIDASLGLPAYLIRHASLTRMNFIAKRAFDLVFSLLILSVTAIPFLLVCLLIRLDSKGPALYRQKRFGYKGLIFEAFKFRTMVADAEARLDDVRGQNDQKGAFFKAHRDPRVTRIGVWLRRFSLDEFPQFLNVFMGEMSVVGPRPLAVATGELERLQRDFGETSKKRLNILPGITGLWQVSGRSDVSSEQRFALDLFYIEHWSLGLDLEIILKTVPAMITGKGAY